MFALMSATFVVPQRFRSSKTAELYINGEKFEAADPPIIAWTVVRFVAPKDQSFVAVDTVNWPVAWPVQPPTFVHLGESLCLDSQT